MPKGADGRQVIPGGEWGSGVGCSPEGRNLDDKPCRNEALYGNRYDEVFRTY
jgi:hypothetical protein